MTDKIRYCLPSAIPFILATVGMALVTDLAIATGPNTADWARDAVIPARWQSITDLSGGLVNVETIMKASFHLWANRTTGTSLVSYYIAIGAWIIHLVEACFAVRKCVAAKASLLVTLLYGFGVFLSGIAQFSTLNAEISRVKASGNKRRKQDK